MSAPGQSRIDWRHTGSSPRCITSGSGSWKWECGPRCATGRPMKPTDLKRAENRKLNEGGVESGTFDQRVKKRDELGLRERGSLMAIQRQTVMDLLERHRGEGRSVSEVLGSMGVARSS